jgi:ABC transporter substrate binding protein (PQQ-dependent alcohol dehydrogenase system)
MTARQEAVGRVEVIRRAAIFALLGLAPTLWVGAPALAQDVAVVRIAYLSQVVERPPKLSNLELPPEDEGVRGGQLAIRDNNTTGSFMKQVFELHDVSVPAAGDVVAAYGQLLADGYRFIILDVPAGRLVELADLPESRGVLLFNAGAPDDRLRNEDCRANVMHVRPSRAMLADGLAQYLMTKRWRSWFLVTGRRDRDRLFAAAVRRAAKRFGGKIVAEKTWDFGADARRTAQSEVPVFTQGIDYDVLVAADEIGEFGEYLAYRTWEPKLVVGTQGLVPSSWHRTHERWGAAQLQSRFRKMTGRHMTPLDYGVWAPIRAIGEAATRTGSTDFEKMAAYIKGPDFELAGFKGQKLTFRPWNNQLRQPVLLVAPTALVSVSPQAGYLHERSLLDTMGYDEPESTCRLP